jgi:tight adherence protein B
VRLKQYGAVVASDASGAGGRRARLRTYSFADRIIKGFGLGPVLASSLVRADAPLTAAEFVLIALASGAAGFLLAAWRGGLLLGLALGVLCAAAPFVYLRMLGQRRTQQLNDQLPDVLTYLVGGLRAGYGLSQAMAMLVEQLPAPASVEFGRVMRGVGLGMQVQRALNQMAERVRSDDLDLVVTAINIQHELGGNLAQTLETIGDLVRDRIRIKREIRTLTSQQRLTGYILAALPVALALGLSVLSPGYLDPLFAPGPIRIMPVAAAAMMILGFLIIRKIVDIEV